MMQTSTRQHVNTSEVKTFFIINKYSGSGFHKEMETLLVDQCRSRGIEFDFAYTQARAHATALASGAIANGYDTVVAIGGDGTVNEVAQAVVNSPASMGIIPKGSGNGLARHLRIPMHFERALDHVFSSEVVTIDTFRLNGHLSLNVSGIGFDGCIADRFGSYKRRGFQGYARIVLDEIKTFQEFEATIHANGEIMQKKAFVIAIANSSQYGNNARIAPSASVSDQLLDISILRRFPAYRLDLVYALFAGTIDRSSHCETTRITNATINVDKPMYFHVDGEPTGKAEEFRIELLPTSLKMLTPTSRV